MTIEDIREHCMPKAGVTEELPFDDKALVYKVLGKMFAITNLATRDAVTLKCDPDYSLELRAKYDAVTPGYHTDKKHWITVYFDGSIPDSEILEWVDNSYDLVVAKLPKKRQQELRDGADA